MLTTYIKQRRPGMNKAMLVCLSTVTAHADRLLNYFIPQNISHKSNICFGCIFFTFLEMKSGKTLAICINIKSSSQYKSVVSNRKY